MQISAHLFCVLTTNEHEYHSDRKSRMALAFIRAISVL